MNKFSLVTRYRPPEGRGQTHNMYVSCKIGKADFYSVDIGRSPISVWKFKMLILKRFKIGPFVTIYDAFTRELLHDGFILDQSSRIIVEIPARSQLSRAQGRRHSQ